MAMIFLYLCFGVLTTYSVEKVRFKDDNIQILLCLKGQCVSMEAMQSQ